MMVDFLVSKLKFNVSLKKSYSKYGNLLVTDIYVMKKLREGVDVKGIRFPHDYKNFKVADSIEHLLSVNIIDNNNNIIISDEEYFDLLAMESRRSKLEISNIVVRDKEGITFRDAIDKLEKSIEDTNNISEEEAI